MKKLNLLRVLLVGLSSLHGISAATEYPIEIISKTPKVTISKVKIDQINGKMILNGLVKRRSYNSSVVPGHIDITIKDSQNRIITNNTLNYTPSLSLRRWKFGSRFNFVLPADLPADSSVQIGWHPNRSKQHLFSSIDKS